VVVVTETEYTGAGKTPWAQLAFAREMGVRVEYGDPGADVPGTVITLPAGLEQVRVSDLDLDAMRRSYVRSAQRAAGRPLNDAEKAFLIEDARLAPEVVAEL